MLAFQSGTSRFAAIFMIRLTSILLIIALLSTSFTRLVFYAGFAVNRDYISKMLCENKAKLVMKCLGKCYLNKKIKQAEEKEQKQGSLYSKINLEIFIHNAFKFRCFTHQTDEYLIPAVSVYLFTSSYKIFQPPRA